MNSNKNPDTERFEETLSMGGLHDNLTGLYSRRGFAEEIKHRDIDMTAPMSVIIGDINGLTLINNAFGQETGDRVIIDIADMIRCSCREKDVIARTGDGEFCVLLPKADSKTAQRICRSIYEKCKQYRSDKMPGSSCAGISLGYHTRTDSSESIETMRKEAEILMYRHKLLETKSVRNASVSTIVSILYEKYGGTEAHLYQMEKLSKETGIALGLSEAELDELGLVSILHDIGKIAISDSIINKNAKLTKEEKREIQNHPESGYRIIQAIAEFKHISEYVLSHHEKWDGTGYPRKLTGEEIPLLSRIIAIVDAYDAMTAKRPYREALPEEYAVNEIKTCAGSQFDPKIAKVFIEKVLHKKWNLI
jgi:diguanylate cyclase (GGDEF)-like protein